jgi:tRNA (adenine22-N1)-methyltransferase
MTGGDLSARLKEVAGMVSPGMYVYDVGCDHGFLSIYLVKYGGAPGAVASDVNPGPLRAAHEHVADEGLDEKIRLIQSNGLHNITKPNEPSVLVMAGMGGPLILDILENSPFPISVFKEIVISPQSRIEDVRSRLPDLGLHITNESMVRDAGKYYTVMKLIPADGSTAHTQHDPGLDALLGAGASHAYDLYGYRLIIGAHPVFKEYLAHEHEILKGVLAELDSSKHTEKYAQITEDIRINELIYKWMEGIQYGYDHD